MTQHQQNAASGERQNYAFQIISSPTADTPGTTIALTFDDNRYLFGHMGEGTQRAMIQRGFGMRKVKNIFLTGTTNWKNNGGLFGTILTLAEVQSQLVAHSQSKQENRPAPVAQQQPWVNIYGSPMLLHTLATARRFIFRTGMPLTVQESTGNMVDWSSDPTYVDDNIRVWSIPIKDLNQTPGNDASQDVAKAIQEEQNTRAKVVQDMFDSDWRKDRLIETKFRDAKLPAMVFIRDPITKELRGRQCPNYQSAPDIEPDQTVLIRNPWPASLVPDLPSASNLPTGVAMSYIVRGHHQRGKFDPKKAIALGVKPGPIFSKLTAGESISLENGTVVKPDDVLGPPRVGKGMAFFDLPTIGHLKSLHLSLQTSSSDALSGVAIAIWILGPGLARDALFGEMIGSLNDLQHFLSDPDTAENKLSYESAALSTSRLAKIDPSRFSLPVYGAEPYQGGTTSQTPARPDLPVIAVEAGMKVHVEPTYEMIRDEIPPLTVLEADPLDLPEQILESTAAVRPSEELSEPEIIALGTGSSQPSKYRNVSATLLRLPHNQGNFLFDCGENTLGQLRRTFTADELGRVFRDLQGIWISHLHADHHLGTISVLQARAQALDALSKAGQDSDRTIYLMSEKNMIDFVNEYSSVEPSILTSTGLVPLVCTQDRGPLLDGKRYDFNNQPTALQEVKTVRVSHCAGAQAVTMTFKSGLKVSYSGDCRPSSQFCEIGQNSDLLIHEATFDDDKQGDALAKKHSTTAEAVGVALKMKAKNVLLTHFSQRYSKIPNLNSVKAPDDIQYEDGAATQDDAPIEDNGPPSADVLVGEDADAAASTDQARRAPSRPPILARTPASDLPIAIAFDLMRIRLSQIATAKRYYPAIETMFALQEAASDVKREENRKLSEANQKNKAEKTQRLWEERRPKTKEKGKGRKREGGEGKEEKHMGRNDDGEHFSTNGEGKRHDHAEIGKQMSESRKDVNNNNGNNLKRKAVSPPPPPPIGAVEGEGKEGEVRPMSKRAQKALARKKLAMERRGEVEAAAAAAEEGS